MYLRRSASIYPGDSRGCSWIHFLCLRIHSRSFAVKSLMSSYRDIKHECYEANLLLPQYKLCDLTFGNVSVADHGRGVFAIKPSGVDYSVLRVEDR
jgi:hypothetical protein